MTTLKRRRAAAVGMAILIAAVLASQMAFGQGRAKVGAMEVTAGVMDMIAGQGGRTSQWVLSGTPSPHARSLDGNIDFRAGKIVIDLNPAAKTRADQVSKVTATGSVSVRAKVETNTVTASSASAVYSASGNTVVLEGNVRATVMDPQFEEPSTLDANKLTVWLTPKPGQSRIKVEGSPARLEVTPKEEPPAAGGNQ